MDSDHEFLKEKALLLLQRERELFELRMKHEHVTLWLSLTRALPQLFADPHIGLAEVCARVRKTLIEGLRLQRTMFLELDGEGVRPLVPAGNPYAISPQALALVGGGTAAGFCNNATDPDAVLATALGLSRFIWTRVDVPGKTPMLLAAGFDQHKAKFQSPFDAGDAAHLRNAAQQLEGLLANALLVQELARERDTLENRVRDRTEQLGRRNRDMRLVLDNVAQALLTIDGDGRLAAERSARADEWFGPYEDAPSFVTYITKTDPDFANNFAVAYEAFNDGILPTDLCLDQLPRRLLARGRIFDCTYRPLPAPEHRGLLIVIADVTQEMKLAQQEAAQTELLAMFKGLTGDRDGFLTFFEETTRLVDELARGGLDDRARARHLHTLKGTAAMHGAQLIAALCHRAEEELAINLEGIDAAVDRLAQRWADVRHTFDAFLDERAKGILEVPQDALDRLIEDFRAGLPGEEIARRAALLALEPVERPLTRLSRYAVTLAARLGKADLSVAVEAAGARVDPRRFRQLWSGLVHLVGNAIDHGIEPAAERLARGKDAQGRLVLRAWETEGELLLEIADDGRGIDWAHVREQAVERGFGHETEADLVQVLLSGGFTTKSSASATSGRGVGMSALHRIVEELGGALSVRSDEGAGTCWRLTFPRSPAREADPKAGASRSRSPSTSTPTIRPSSLNAPPGISTSASPSLPSLASAASDIKAL